MVRCVRGWARECLAASLEHRQGSRRRLRSPVRGSPATTNSRVSPRHGTSSPSPVTARHSMLSKRQRNMEAAGIEPASAVSPVACRTPAPRVSPFEFERWGRTCDQGEASRQIDLSRLGSSRRRVGSPRHRQGVGVSEVWVWDRRGSSSGTGCTRMSRRRQWSRWSRASRSSGCGRCAQWQTLQLSPRFYD
jgi:hypothetical protein